MIETEEEARAFVAARCDTGALKRLDEMVARLASESRRQNLVSEASISAVWRRHVADSAQLLDLGAEEKASWLDLGTGAGFPGIVVALMRPDMSITLVESRRLRVEWLNTLVETLGMANCTVRGVRVEQFEGSGFAAISARAFAPLPKLLALARRFSTSATLWLLPKGRSAAQEVANLPEGLRRMFHVEPSVTDPEAGIVVGRIEEDGRR